MASSAGSTCPARGCSPSSGASRWRSRSSPRSAPPAGSCSTPAGTTNLGGSTWDYWRHVGAPLLAPAFLGATLLLFANALSAYATIQAWENQISYTVPQQIYIAINSEVGLASNASDVLALGMVVMVAIIMIGYFLLQRRAARWLR